MGLMTEAYRNRPTRAEVSLRRLRENLGVVRSFVGPSVRIMAMVKSNAYGHGIVEASRAFLDAGAEYLGVAYLEEAVYLRESGVNAPILVCGAINTDQIEDFIRYGVDITSSSLDKSRAIAATAQRLGRTARVHLKVDTGMERIGVHWYHAENFINGTMELPGLEIVGIFSHLARADTDPSFTEEQVRRMDQVAAYMARKNILPPFVHLANSAAVIAEPRSYYTMVRPGIMLYGYNPFGLDSPHHVPLRPAMTLKTKVSFFKVVPAGTGISYGHTYVTTRQTRVVTLPLGYGDGYRRHLSNRGQVMIRGRRYPVVGTICMDQIMVDIGPDGTAYNGDDVLLFGEMDGYTIPLETLCDAIGTITYEFLCGIAPRVPRVYVDDK